MKINVGCGSSPTPGWRNFDNSPSIRLSRWPLVAGALEGLGMLSADQRNYIRFCAAHAIEFADAHRRIPLPDDSAEVVYSCHMLEHLGRDEARGFLREALRVLSPRGVLRIAVPDLRFYVDKYAADSDLDHFMEQLHLTRPPPRGLRAKVKYLLVGDRHHQWMYDGPYLCRLLAECGFDRPNVVPAGTTQIADPGQLNLSERAPESLYVEAFKPTAKD